MPSWHRRPQFLIATITGRNPLRFGVGLHTILFVPSAEGHLLADFSPAQFHKAIAHQDALSVAHR